LALPTLKFVQESSRRAVVQRRQCWALFNFHGSVHR